MCRTDDCPPHRHVRVAWCAAARVFHVTLGGVTLHLPAEVLLEVAEALDEVRASLATVPWSPLRPALLDET